MVPIVMECMMILSKNVLTQKCLHSSLTVVSNRFLDFTYASVKCIRHILLSLWKSKNLTGKINYGSLY